MPNGTVSNTKCHKQLSISCVGSAMGVYENCKAKIKKKNKTEQQEKPEILKKNSSLSAKEAFKNGGPDHIAAQTVPFRELAAATRNFGADCLLGEGSFGRVYKGRLRSTKQDVAIKKLRCNKWQRVGEFLVEESMFGLLHHPHFVNLIGYCLRGCERFLVYEYMPLGSLDEHLHKTSPGKKPLDWSTRMKIAAGVAKGLEYLHDEVSPPVMYRNLKCSNILLGEGYHPKLSDVGSAEHGFVKEDECMHVKIRVPRRNEYIDPDYATTGQLTLKSDVYSFGVLLLEIITGRKVVDQCRRDKYLVTWARSRWSRPAQVVDPMLQGQYPQRGLRKALGVAASCVDYNPYMRPVIAKVVIDLNNIASQKYDPDTQPG